MKKTFNNLSIIIFFLFGLTTNMFGQDSNEKQNDLGTLALTTFVSPTVESTIGSSGISILKNKLNEIVTANGISSSGFDSRFIITANVSVLTKDMVVSSPPMTALTLNVTFYVGDGFDGKIFSSQSLTLKGAGTNENKAYIEALKRIKPNDTSLQSLVSNGKGKIITYYNTKCAQILKEAQSLEASNQLDEAILKLASVPAECTDCYAKSSEAGISIYKKKIDRDCQTKLAQATNLWNANQTLESANAVGEIVSTISPEASCFKEVKALFDKIGDRVAELDKREWEYKIKTEIDMEKERINAIRDIGVAYGNNQPDTVYNVKGWW